MKEYPIHPVYQKYCQENNHDFNQFMREVQDLSLDEKLQKILKMREKSNTKPNTDHRTVRYQQKVCGFEGVEASTTLFRPNDSEHELLPVILFCHGGGWVFGSVDSYATFINNLCIETHAAVMAVDYSHSPEQRFPVANNQAFSALCWLWENGKSIFVDPNKISVMGDSAGGNMATVVSMMAKDKNMNQMIKSTVLIYPVVSFHNTTYPSYQKYGKGDLPLSTEMVDFSASLYLSKPAYEYNDRYVTPITATQDQLKGLPPTLILTSECDILCDEGEAYASKLLQAGVNTLAVRILGTFHEYISLPLPETPQYKLSMQIISNFLKDQMK